MGDKPADPRGQSSARVKRLFNRIALRYDLINDLQSFGLHRLWKRRVLKLASVRTGDKALDLCCGTGDISFALTQEGAEVVGLDFSEGMLKVAEARAKALGTGAEPSNPRFLDGNAEQIPFPDNTFDIVTVGYGLRNLENWETGLSEMWRVSKPGGRLLVLDFGKPENTIWRGVYFGYLKVFVPMFGAVFCGDAGAYAYILESLKRYSAQRGVDAKLRELGCRDLSLINLIGGAMSINYAKKPSRMQTSGPPTFSERPG